MNLHDLSPAEGSVKSNYRKGRGHGSGNGKTAGRGHKGQWARSGGGVRPGRAADSRRAGDGNALPPETTIKKAARKDRLRIPFRKRNYSSSFCPPIFFSIRYFV